MSFIEILLIGVGLSMDAFAVALCKGMSTDRCSLRFAGTVGAYFGFFQFLMPVIGYFAAAGFRVFIERVDHWVVFALLLLIGAEMIKGSREDAKPQDGGLSFRNMLILAVATSIDALAVGISLAFLSVRILPSAAVIGVTTFILSFAGAYIGSFFGARLKSKAELAGGVILILIGTKILLEHLGIINFR